MTGLSWSLRKKRSKFMSEGTPFRCIGPHCHAVIGPWWACGSFVGPFRSRAQSVSPPGLVRVPSAGMDCHALIGHWVCSSRQSGSRRIQGQEVSRGRGCGEDPNEVPMGSGERNLLESQGTPTCPREIQRSCGRCVGVIAAETRAADRERWNWTDTLPGGIEAGCRDGSPAPTWPSFGPVSEGLAGKSNDVGT